MPNSKYFPDLIESIIRLARRQQKKGLKELLARKEMPMKMKKTGARWRVKKIKGKKCIEM